MFSEMMIALRQNDVAYRQIYIIGEAEGNDDCLAAK